MLALFMIRNDFVCGGDQENDHDDGHHDDLECPLTRGSHCRRVWVKPLTSIVRCVNGNTELTC